MQILIDDESEKSSPFYDISSDVYSSSFFEARHSQEFEERLLSNRQGGIYPAIGNEVKGNLRFISIKSLKRLILIQ